MGIPQESDLSGLVSTGKTTSATLRLPAVVADEDDFDPYGTGNPNIADTPRNLREHGIDPDARYPAK
jgi:hypothetical protein